MSANDPAVTAIVPAYNMARYVGRTLLSAAGQTYANLDIIVVDDGSTDETPQIVERLSCDHPRIRLVSTANAGVAAARNLGLELSGGDYVAFLDADDLWHPRKIERQVAALARHGHDGDWAGCYTWYRFMDEEDQVLGDGHTWQLRGSFFHEQLLSNPFGNGSNLLVRREAALAAGGFNPEYAAAGIGGCEDQEFQLSLLRRHKIEVVPEFLVGYRIHPQQMSSDVIRMRLGHLAVVENAVERGAVPRRSREAALVHAYLVAAKGYALTGDWRRAARLLRQSLVTNAGRTAMRLAGFLRFEAGYWTSRAAGRVGPKRAPAPPRRFEDLTEHEPAGDGGAVPAYRPSLLSKSRARRNDRAG